MISDMIAKLEDEAGEDATKKAYCDKELSETNAKKADKSDDLEELGTKIDQASAKSTKLKEEVATLQKELSTLVKTQAEIDKAAKEKDVQYKTKEAKGLDKSITELSSDKDNTKEQLDAVLEYLSKVEGECIAKPESYEERKKRREAELAGLKEGLEVLESETALIQRVASHRRKALRGDQKTRGTIIAGLA